MLLDGRFDVGKDEFWLVGLSLAGGGILEACALDGI